VDYNIMEVKRGEGWIVVRRSSGRQRAELMAVSRGRRRQMRAHVDLKNSHLGRYFGRLRAWDFTISEMIT
jgi:hypothetical protein